MIGVDEVGRGCWAGPLLVVAARQTDKISPEVTDSKLLNRAQRKRLFIDLINYCDFGEGWVEAIEIDNSGLSNALRLGVARALQSLRAANSEEIILDGSVNYCDPKYINSNCLISADLDVPLVSAASIYAKVIRDEFMQNLGIKYPDYGFENHVGYGTKAHRNALEQHGILEGVHRISFKPVGAFQN